MGIGRTVQIMKDPHLHPEFLRQHSEGESKSNAVYGTYMRYELTPSSDNKIAGGGVNKTKQNLASSMSIKNVKFRPLEDVLSIGHSHGVTTIVVPGAGEGNFDAFENNPFLNPKQRREQEVQSLLHKLSPDTIALGKRSFPCRSSRLTAYV